MDVWSWIYQLARELWTAGRGDVADLIFDYSDICLHGNTEAVEASYQQLLQSSKELELPWLEIYARHWYLQHQLCTRNNINVGLPGAVRLLEIAHREENRDCPQSVCAVQDLGIAYGSVDGPGYAEERKQVSSETLERIDPRWPCFECISAEYAQALIDEEKPQEALNFLSTQLRAMGKPEASTGEFQRIRADAYLKVGENERALRLTQKEYSNAGESENIERRALYAVALARLGKPEKALKNFPSWKTAHRLPGTADLWAEALLELADLGVIQDEDLLEYLDPLYELTEMLTKLGGIRPAFQVGVVATDLARRCDEQVKAKRSLDALRELLPRLRKPCGADARLAQLEKALA